MRQLFNFISQSVALAGISLVIGIMLARGLGPESRGELALYQTCALFVTNILPWGTHVNLSRLIAKHRSYERFFYTMGYKIAAAVGGAGLFAYVALGALVDWFSLAEISLKAFIVSAVIIPFSIINAFQIQMELGRGNQFNLAVVRLSVSLTQFAGIIYWVLLGQLEVLKLLMLFATSSLLGGLIGVVLIQRSLSKDGIAPQINVKSMFRTSQKFGITILVSSLLLNADKFGAAFLFNGYDFGLYIVAAGLAQTIHIVGEGFSQLMFVRVARQTTLGHEQWADIAKRLRLTVFSYILICVGLMLALPLALPIIYGHEYQAAAAYLLVLTPAAVLQSLCRSFEEMIKALDGSLRLLLVAIVPICLIFLFSVVGSWYSSLWVLAGGVLAAQLVCSGIYLAIVMRLSGMPARRLLIANREDFAAFGPKRKA